MKSDSNQDNSIKKYFLNPKELAQYFGVSLKTVYRIIEKRKIPFYKI
jgi:predicted DNA-binding transcriptional regulator AlpA